MVPWGERQIWRSPFLFSTSNNMPLKTGAANRKVKLEKVKLEKMKLDESFHVQADLKSILVAISKEYMLK
jgi:hypothetical protein